MKYKITLNNRVYEVEVEAGKAMLLDEYEAVAPAAAPVVVGAGDPVCAPMPGTIVRVNVSQGQTVNAGDVLCVLEAMKMENDITAPKAGTVTQVVAAKGSSVSSGDVLIVIG